MTKNIEVIKLKLRAVFYRECGCWMAHCLEMGVIGHGRTRKSALKQLTDAIFTQVSESLKAGNPDNIFMSADAVYQRMFFTGYPCVVGELKARFTVNSSPEVEIEGLEVHEYQGQALPAYA